MATTEASDADLLAAIDRAIAAGTMTVLTPTLLATLRTEAEAQATGE